MNKWKIWQHEKTYKKYKRTDAKRLTPLPDFGEDLSARPFLAPQTAGVLPGGAPVAV